MERNYEKESEQRALQGHMSRAARNVGVDDAGESKEATPTKDLPPVEGVENQQTQRVKVGDEPTQTEPTEV